MVFHFSEGIGYRWVSNAHKMEGSGLTHGYVTSGNCAVLKGDADADNLHMEVQQWQVISNT